jgi:dienelactone hydrolase
MSSRIFGLSFLAIALLALAISWLVWRPVAAPSASIARHAGEAEAPHGDYNQQLWWIPVRSLDQSSGENLLLEAMVYRPSGPGPFPLVVIDHGKPALHGNASDYQPRFEAAAHWFVEHGFAVTVLARRGYGRSQGTISDIVGSCSDMDYYATARQTARDTEGLIVFMRQQSFIDPAQIIAVGHSHGGLGVLGLATIAPRGLVGAISFAGGSGAWGSRGKFCNGRDHLVAAMRKLGSETKLPELWLYALNDDTFDPALAAEMQQAFNSVAARPALLVTLPAAAPNGHMLFPSGNAPVWGPHVQQFLDQILKAQ